MATTIPTLSTGNVLTATEWNYLTALNTQTGLYDTTTSVMAGTAPTTTAPNGLVQGGVTTLTLSGGAAFLTFPTAFPNCLISFSGIVYSAVGNAAFVALSATAPSTSAVSLAFYQIGGADATGSTKIAWTAIGG